METVIVQRVELDARLRSTPIGLRPGESLSFGRGMPTQSVDIALVNPEIPRIAGRITAVDDHWTLSNLSRTSTYVVENPEGGGEHAASQRALGHRTLVIPVVVQAELLVLAIAVASGGMRRQGV